MPMFAPDLPLAEFTLVFDAIVALLVPLLIWLFFDLEQRRQRRLARLRFPREVAALRRGARP